MNTDIHALAIRIADESTRSDIETLCSRVEYLTLRKRIERRGSMVRVAGFGHD